MSLEAFRRAQEDKFFKIEQERDILNYVERLKKEGRFDKIPEAVPRTFAEGGALPQVLAHQMRLAAPQAATLNKRVLDRSFMTRHVIKGQCTGNPMYVGSVTLGSSVSLGKSKWTAGTSSVEGATIFSVHKANELMSQAPKHLDGIESRAAKHMVDTSVMEIAGRKFKLMPDPTPGRAMAWGGTLAVWGTAVITVGACRALGIRSMDDVKRVMGEKLRPWANMVRDNMEPLKANLGTASGGGGATVGLSDSRFAKDIKAMFASR